MPWPPTTIPPNTRGNTTSTPENHKDDHNNTSDALTSIVAELGSDPAGASADVTARLSAIDTSIAAAIAKSIGTTQGDTIYWTGSATPVRLAKGTAYQKYRMNSGATAPEWATTTFRQPFGFALDGTGSINVLPGFYVSLPTGQTATIAKVRYATTSGTATISVLKNGSGATGFTALSVSSTAASTTPTAVALADDDYISIDITAASTPIDFRATVFIDFVIP